MNLSGEEVEQHCRNILGEPAIKNKIVVLCEGKISLGGERLSPALYGRMSEFSDANFYTNCIPHYWTRKPPQFFNCGGRQDTLKTYFKLLEIHDLDPRNSYLSPDKLFALVDLDLCIAKIEDYDFADTENIFYDLYKEFNVRFDRLPNHRIWVTGFKHKEAYFINPDLQQIFDRYHHENDPVMYKDEKLNLENIYRDITEKLSEDKDLQSNFAIASKRIQHCHDIECLDLDKLAKSWLSEWERSGKCRDELVLSLLTIAHSKTYWEKVTQGYPKSELSPRQFRDTLSLYIATEFYAKQSGNECLHYHLPCFFKYLYDRVLS
jgi:hypothetical protein